MPSLLRDLRHALRMLRRSPVYAVASIAVVALGIGSSTAIFSVINRVLFAPLPYPEADRLVQMVGESPMGISQMASIPKFNVWREAGAAFQFIAAYDSPATVRVNTEEILAQHVSADYFSVFGLKVAHGRVFSRDEDRPGAGHVAVASHRLWVRNPGILERYLTIEGQPYQVIGILDQQDEASSADLFLPLQADPLSADHSSRIRVVARLAPGVTFETAQHRMYEMNGIFHGRFPFAMATRESSTVMPLRDVLVGDVRQALWMLSCAVGVLLLSACANVASLQLAHATRRARDIATRAALGASRPRLIGQLLTESILLCVAGGGLGIALGRFAVLALLSLYPGAMPLTTQHPVELDSRVLLFSHAVVMATGVLCGLFPALSASRVDLSAVFKDGGASAGSSPLQVRLRSLLVIGEFALAMVLLVATGLMIRLYARMNHGDRGFDANSILTLEMPLGGMDKTAAVDNLIQNAERRIRTVPGVQGLAATEALPLESSIVMPYTIDGLALMGAGYHGLAQWRGVSLRYFEVFRIRLTRGRAFTNLDAGPDPPVVIINETLARKWWPGGNPVGKRLILGMNAGTEVRDKPREIVGVVADIRETGLARIPEPAVYIPAAQAPDGLTALNNRRAPLTWVVRTSGDPARLSNAIQRELRAASEGFSFGRIRLMNEVVAESTARLEFNALLLMIFSGIALALAAVGLYGLMAYSVEQRTQEIGIRMAIGASPEDVRDLFVWQAFRLAFAGIATGFLAASAVARIMSAEIWGIDTSGPELFFYVTILLCVTTLAAAYLPARKALRTDPSIVLRRL